MSSAVRQHAIYRLANTPVRAYPFPHVVVEDILPADTYAELQANLPTDEQFTVLADSGRVGGHYSRARLALFQHQTKGANDDRLAFWDELFETLNHPDFAVWTILKFRDQVTQRFGQEPSQLFASNAARSEIFLMRDLETYSLGPHTDSPAKLVSVLFYLPPDDRRPELGTSLYAPRDPAFVCPGGPHHKFEKFERVFTVPYRPNTLVAFPKTSRCFHGVEPVSGPDTRRDLMLFDLKLPQAA